MKLVIADNIAKVGIDILRKSGMDIEILADLPKDKLRERLQDADAIITRSATNVDKKLLDAAPKLKVIVRAGVGVDNVDIEYASKLGVLVMNVPAANTVSAVEHTMNHILCCLRMLPYAHDELKNKKIWNRKKWMGKELYGKVVGIIGFGHIGPEVAKRCMVFNAKVLVYDPYIKPEKATNMNCAYLSDIKELIKRSDIITIHTPKTEETINMITEKELAIAKDGVILINCARGGLYNEQDLYNGLKSGKIRAAGIDVFEHEPPKDSPLLSLDNIIVTPHIGANTKEAQLRIAVEAADEVIKALKGEGYTSALNLPMPDKQLPANLSPFMKLSEKMAKILRTIMDGSVKKVEISTSGPISEFLPILKPYIYVGILKRNLKESLNYVNSGIVAEERGITTVESSKKTGKNFTNLLSIRLTTQNSSRSIYGTVFESGQSRIVGFDDFAIEVAIKPIIIFMRNHDIPGFIGRVGTIIGKASINIADFRLGRQKKGDEAISLISVDTELTLDTLNDLKSIEGAIEVKQIFL